MFRVKALYDYASPHEDDLSFKTGQIISVTEEEGEDWYVGEYIDDTGTKHDGLFPTNFVQKYEPEPPPRPNRASRHKPLEQPQVQAAPPIPQEQHHDPEPVQQQQHHHHHHHHELEEQELEAQPPPPPLPIDKPEPVSISSPIVAPARAPEPPHVQQEAAKPAPAPAKKAPPPIAAKSNAFRDRIAAFNAPAAAPIQPFKPSGASTTFIKKPFVAPPPSRNAYVPPPVRDIPQPKTYRRDEDPEIAERQAQAQDAAERAGLVAHNPSAAQDGEQEDQPKPTSLKERIALLQKQQQEQAERAATMHKEKPKRPPVRKRAESHDGPAEDSEDTGLDKVTTASSKDRASIDHARPPRSSHDNRNRDFLSDANDADQSGAGETEDAEGESTSVEDDEDRARTKQPPPLQRAPTAPSKEPDVGDEQDVEEEEEEEEDEMDAETRRKLELRERMAKMSGGMGMAGMFGGMPMGGLPPKKKKPAEKKVEEDDEYTSPQQRIPMFAMPSIPTSKNVDHEKEDDMARSFTSSHASGQVADEEDASLHPIQRTPTGERPPPVPTDRRPLPPPVPSASRPVPPPLPNITSPGPGSESGDEMTDSGANAMSPKTPSAPFAPPPKRSSYFGGSNESPQASLDKRVPSFPIASPTSSIGHRLPPPLPPTQPPPTHHANLPSRPLDRTEGETDYEGDYDTDIAPGATHKEALKSHSKEPSMDDSIGAGELTSARSPTTPHGPLPLPPAVPRAVPPPPPQQAPIHPSMDAPRVVPPPPPVPPPTRDEPQDEDDDDYDPYRYTAPAVAPPTPRAMPPLPQSHPPPPQNRPPPPMPPLAPPVPQHQAAESSDDDELYSSPPPRKSHDRLPPPPPQAPPHQQAPPPPLQERAAPPPPPQERAAPPPPPAESQARAPTGKKSFDVSRAMAGRSSTDQTRSAANQDFIASDLDLGASSHWWTQPKLLPPSLQNRKDVLVNMNESQSGSTVEKLISVLYLDYSQTTVSARFENTNVSDVQLEQQHDPPPGRQRPDQLEGAYEQFGRRIAKDVESKQNTVLGNGTPQGLIEELLKPYNDALPPVSTRAYGALVYANLANASTQSNDEIRPGDIISFRNAKFQGKTGAMHAKYSVDVGKPDHVGVVVEWDGSKKKVRVWEQGREHKKVKPESFKMGDLRSGEVRVWRVMSKNWVGWS